MELPGFSLEKYHFFKFPAKFYVKLWLLYLKDLESFMDMCRMAAKFYIDAIQRLKKFNENNSPSILWSFSLVELDGRLEK